MKPQTHDLLGARAKLPRVSEFEEKFAFQCRAFKLPAAQRQYHWATDLKRRFCADFAFLDYRLIVEIQGGIWRPGGGAHSRPQAIEGDIEKAQYAALLEYVWLPFTGQEVTKGHAIEWTQRVLYKLGWRPTI